MSTVVTELDEVFARAAKLSPLDKIRLVEKLMGTLEEDVSEQFKAPLRSALGLWQDFGIDLSADDIEAARDEMLKNFPREDF